MQQRTIEISAQRSLHFVQAGKGRDLLLLHGALGTHQDWLIGPFDRLAEEYRVTAVDRPGHGKSRRPRFEGSPRDQAAQIVAAAAEMGVERATIVGHSIGGIVALAMAESFPDFVSSLVLIAPLCFPEARPLDQLLMAPRALPIGGPAFSQFAKWTFDPLVLKMAQRIMFSPQPVPDHWEKAYPYADILRSDAMVSEGEETAAMLPMSPAGSIDMRAIRAPVTILTGTSDKVVNPMIHARPLAAMLKGSRLIELKGIGHMAHHAAADEVVQAIREGAARAVEPQSSAR